MPKANHPVHMHRNVNVILDDNGLTGAHHMNSTSGTSCTAFAGGGDCTARDGTAVRVEEPDGREVDVLDRTGADRDTDAGRVSVRDMVADRVVDRECDAGDDDLDLVAGDGSRDGVAERLLEGRGVRDREADHDVDADGDSLHTGHERQTA